MRLYTTRNECVSLAYLLTGADLSHIYPTILITPSIYFLATYQNTLDILQNGTSSHPSIVTPLAAVST
jgi:hypothetical protein